MHITEQTPRVTRTILGFQVQVPQPYQAGTHEMTEGEKDALNQTFWENNRNNLAAKVEAIRKDETIAPEDKLAEIQKLLDEGFASYVFGVRKAGGGPVRDPVRNEAIKLARMKLKEKFVEAKKDLPSKEVFEEMVTKLVDGQPQWLEAGKLIVEQRAAVGAKLSVAAA